MKFSKLIKQIIPDNEIYWSVDNIPVINLSNIFMPDLWKMDKLQTYLFIIPRQNWRCFTLIDHKDSEVWKGEQFHLRRSVYLQKALCHLSKLVAIM